MTHKHGKVLLRAVSLAVLTLVGSSGLYSAEIITFGRNEADWNDRLGVTAIRMGCSAGPSTCVAAARKMANEQSVKRIYLAVHLTASIVDDMKAYATLLKGAPMVVEIGFDDFPLQYRKLAETNPSARDLLSHAFRIAEQAGIGLGITIYDDQIDSPWISSWRLPKGVRSKINYVHFYLHYRDRAREYSSDLRRVDDLFPNAAIIGGAYAYDRIDYSPCRQGSHTHCSLDDEYRLFRQSFEEQVRLMERGKLAAIEFYPAQFGREEQWSGWSNDRACQPDRRNECIRQTKKMREAAIAVLEAAQ